MSGARYIAAVSYNACSLVRHGRMHTISSEFENIHIGGFQGTRIRTTDSDHTTFSTKNHIIINFGWKRSPFVNRSAGVTFMLTRKWFRPRDIIRIVPVPIDLQGRCAALVLKFGTVKLLALNIYFPPPGSMPQALYKKCVEKIMAWLQKTYGRYCREDTTPILFTDLNDGMIRWSDEDLVTKYNNPKGEGYAGEFLHAFADKNRLASAGTQSHSCKSTYFSPNDGQSLVDHVFIPMDSLPTVGTACVLYRSGARLQLIDDRLPRDHFPVLIRFEVAATFVKRHHDNGAAKWDFDKISKAFRTGNGIKQFVESLNAKWSSLEHTDIDHQDMTKEWEAIVADISQAAKPLFEKKNKPYHTPEYLEMANTRDKLLMIQRQVKEVASSTYEDVSTILKD
jgi:hypothetical protein